MRRLRPGRADHPFSAARYTLRQLATRIMALTDKIDDLNRRLATLLERHAPGMLTRVGVGPGTAAAMLVIAGDNPDRAGQRRVFRRSLRRQPDRSVIREDPPSPPQPRW